MKTTRLKPSACLNCGAPLSGATCVDADVEPEPGYVTICIWCGHIMAFAEDLSLRSLTDEEVHDVAGDPRILAIQRARAKL